MEKKKIAESKGATIKRVHGALLFRRSLILTSSGELITKWKRNLDQLSVGADVPRMVKKILVYPLFSVLSFNLEVVNKSMNPPMIWPPSGETASSSMASIAGFFRSCLRGLGEVRLLNNEKFTSLFPPESDSSTKDDENENIDEKDIQQPVQKFCENLGEDHSFVKLLKCACSQVDC